MVHINNLTIDVGEFDNCEKVVRAFSWGYMCGFTLKDDEGRDLVTLYFKGQNPMNQFLAFCSGAVAQADAEYARKQEERKQQERA